MAVRWANLTAIEEYVCYKLAIKSPIEIIYDSFWLFGVL